jgi:hypothetical protein
VAKNDNSDFTVDGFAKGQPSHTRRGVAHICCRQARTKTAVLPIPDLA